METSTDTSWRGNCYLNSIMFLYEYQKSRFDLKPLELEVVHGIVTGQGEHIKNKEIVHSWVEDSLYCYDHDARTNLVEQIPKLQYYVLGHIQVKNTRRYNPTQIMEMVAKYNHAGPFDEMLQNVAENEVGSIWVDPNKGKTCSKNL